ncbi:leader peptidase (Prepilin peptidase) / N-methyltransferase [Candidatus Nitrosoglobus terrae]|uniref:Prepilin leader peptidase/N-methyltransferase n=1 Tax=Candidatus Nitrosoglobus terrae TaxID=1630141 RepID=A0A1Q2SPP5_9GAMM|nr:A24 family peptidase [Candidatus Nitrosoglobus terrae]BAW81096.1 leader peptidase (Prepilin peptidase) / N-methyltransferase [Candidatus Nitrosoglobus terrae]
METITFLNDHPMSFLGSIFLLGLTIGSFLNVVIYRLPLMMENYWQQQYAELQGNPLPELKQLNLCLPRSHCPRCNHVIQIWENIPILSYLLLKGRCNHCGSPISPRYLLVEILTAIFSVAIAWRFGVSWQTIAALVLSYALIALTFIDLDHQLLPDSITLPFLWLGLTLNLFNLFTDIRASVIGAIAGYLSLWLVYHVFRILTHKEGMGYGDFKLLALLGAWLGWIMLPAIILLSSLVGAVLGTLWLYLSHQSKESPLPFGPYLAAAGWLALMWGRDINQFYLSITGLG